MSRRLITVVASLLLVPLGARCLGAEGYGYWNLIGTFAYLLSLADLGLGSAVLRASVHTHPARAKWLVARAIRRVALVGVPAAGFAYVYLLQAARPLTGLVAREVGWALTISLLAGLLQAASQPVRLYAQGRGRLMILSTAGALAAGTQLTLTWCLFRAGYNLSAMAIGYAASVIIELGFGWWAAHDDDPKGEPWSPEELREHARVGRAALLTNLAVVASVRLDVVILEISQDLGAVAAYGLCARLVDQGFTLVKQVGTALVPRLGLGNHQREQTLQWGTITLGSLASAPLAATAIGGSFLLVLWAGPVAQHPLVPGVLALLSLAAMVASWEECACSFLSLGHDAAYVGRSIALAALVNVALSLCGAWLKTPYIVAAATIVANTVTAVLAWRRIIKRCTWTWRQVGAALAPPWVGGMTAAALTWWVSTWQPHPLVTLPMGTLLGLTASFFMYRRLRHQRWFSGPALATLPPQAA